MLEPKMFERFQRRASVVMMSLTFFILVSLSPALSSTSSHRHHTTTNRNSTGIMMSSSSILMSPSFYLSSSPILLSSSDVILPSSSSSHLSSLPMMSSSDYSSIIQSSIIPTSTSSSSSSSSTSTSSSSSSSSSSSTSSSTSSTPVPSHTPRPPEEQILVVEDSCFFFEATEIKFTYYDKRFFNTSTLHLSTLYPDPHDVVTGCTVDSRKHSFKRTYFNFGSAIFNITFEFTLNRVEDSWYLSGLQVANLTTDDNHLFDYGTCGDAISVPEELSYYCSDVNCYGHEQVDESVSVSLNIADLRVDAFVKSGIEPAKDVSMCGVASHSNSKAVIIVALVVTITLLLSVIIIIISFIYKRCRYGKYNLLD